jgi:hypothetical protein
MTFLYIWGLVVCGYIGLVVCVMCIWNPFSYSCTHGYYDTDHELSNYMAQEYPDHEYYDTERPRGTFK